MVGVETTWYIMTRGENPCEIARRTCGVSIVAKREGEMAADGWHDVVERHENGIARGPAASVERIGNAICWRLRVQFRNGRDHGVHCPNIKHDDSPGNGLVYEAPDHRAAALIAEPCGQIRLKMNKETIFPLLLAPYALQNNHGAHWEDRPCHVDSERGMTGRSGCHGQ
jgi:hypothetical protein